MCVCLCKLGKGERLVGWVCNVYAFMVCVRPISIIITLNDYQQIVIINLLPYRIMNSELNSSVVQESFEFSDSDTIISSSSISLPGENKTQK